MIFLQNIIINAKKFHFQLKFVFQKSLCLNETPLCLSTIETFVFAIVD